MHIHLDLLGGLAGDMFLAGAIDAGLVDVEALQAALRTVGLGEGVRIVTERVVRGAIEGTHVRFEGWDPAAEADHRHLTEIHAMLDGSGLPAGVKARARAMFDELGRAESAIHGMPLERVHFHEVGAVDSILDFVSAAWILEHVEATWSIGDVPAGSGTIETDHGTIPVPAPATAKLLEGFPIVYRDVRMEFVTPTGAAILRALDPQFGGGGGTSGGVPVAGRLRATGYGCGTRDSKAVSNVVRFVVLDTAQAKGGRYDEDVVTRLATEIDDLSPEVLAYVEARLFEAGALDVVREPVVMKKGRQGVRLTVLCDGTPDAVRGGEIVELLFRETTTFGLRIDQVARLKLPREIRMVETAYGEVRVKVGFIDGTPARFSPEFEDCAARAREHGVSLQQVYAAAARAAENSTDH